MKKDQLKTESKQCSILYQSGRTVNNHLSLSIFSILSQKLDLLPTAVTEIAEGFRKRPIIDCQHLKMNQALHGNSSCKLS